MTDEEVNFNSAETLDDVLGQLAGYASMCWNQEVHTNAMVFDSDKAVVAVKAAADRIAAIQSEKRFGNIDLMNDKIYVFFTAEDPDPVAMYIGAMGEYDAYYDFAYNYCGSPLADICGRTTYAEFMENVAEGLVEHGWEFVNVVMDDIHQVHNQLGITIEEVMDMAFKYLVEQNYSELPETTISAMLRIADSWA